MEAGGICFFQKPAGQYARQPAGQIPQRTYHDPAGTFGRLSFDLSAYLYPVYQRTAVNRQGCQPAVSGGMHAARKPQRQPAGSVSRHT